MRLALVSLMVLPNKSMARKERDLSKEENAFVTEIGKAAKVLGGKTDESLQRVNMTPTLFREQWEDKVSPLLYPLLTTAERACFDPRDKVYAFYGMFPAVVNAYPPDYHKDPDLVFRQTTAFIINHESGASMYRTFRLWDGHLDNMSFPSWVPDFPRLPNSNVIAPHGYSSSERVSMQPMGALRRLDDAPAANIDDTFSILSLSARDLAPLRVAFQFGDRLSTVLRQVRGLLKTDPTSVPQTSVGRMVPN